MNSSFGGSFESRLRKAEIFGQDVLRRVGHPIREQHGGKLRKVAVVENQQKLRAIRVQSLDGVRNAGGKIP